MLTMFSSRKKFPAKQIVLLSSAVKLVPGHLPTVELLGNCVSSSKVGSGGAPGSPGLRSVELVVVKAVCPSSRELPLTSPSPSDGMEDSSNSLDV